MSNRRGPAFSRYIGIDYSGAMTAEASLKGLRVYMADRETLPVEVPPPPSPRWYWSRREIAEWLTERLSEDRATLVGIDHGFSFPLKYFTKHKLPRSWPVFLADFQRHWPTDAAHTYVDFVRDGSVGNGAARTGYRRWRRLTEERAGSAKSVFHFDVQGSVAKSTHAGIPWLLFLRRRLGERVHFWPFDGWAIPAGRSAIAEVYPRLCSASFPRGDRTADQHDAYSVAAWLRQVDLDGALTELLTPTLDPKERAIAEIEGWILGVPPVPVAAEESRSTVKPRPPARLAQKRLGRHEVLASKYTYRVSWSDEDREYVAICIECASLSGLGDSQEAALAEARAVVAAWLEHLEAEGRPAPQRL
jgi:predicted RNase H-like HicB family nuclease